MAIYQADVVEFTSGCPGIAASLVYLRTGKVDPQTGEVDSRVPVSTLSQVSERERETDSFVKGCLESVKADMWTSFFFVGGLLAIR